MMNDLWDGESLEEDDYGADFYEEEYFEGEEEYENEVDSVIEYGVCSRKVDIPTRTVEFLSDEDTPLQYVFDEISRFIEYNKMDFVMVQSMHTYLGDDGDHVMVVTFNVQGE